jgi:RecA/RadA recombinase
MDLPLGIETLWGARLASALLHRARVPTGCGSFDAALGGGFGCGMLTEVIGTPGSGKTQVALSACASATAAGGSAIYVDADGAFLPSRARELVNTRLQSDGKGSGEDGSQAEQALGRWLLTRVCSFDELAGGVAHVLPEILQGKGDINIIVVDSVSQPFRTFERQGAKKRLEAFAGRMADVALRFNVAVVLINNARIVEQSMAPRQGYARVLASEVGIAAMGDAWAHVCPCRVGLGRDSDGDRVAHVFKDSRMPRGAVKFSITRSGITDAS